MLNSPDFNYHVGCYARSLPQAGAKLLNKCEASNQTAADLERPCSEAEQLCNASKFQ